MDSNKKPQISRELLQRISTFRADSIKAYGLTRANKRLLNPDRKKINRYQDSLVANPGLMTNSDTRSIHNKQTTSQTNSSNALERKHQAFNANNSPTFKEPPSRNYNPFS